jgi:hypothetical protein
MIEIKEINNQLNSNNETTMHSQYSHSITFDPFFVIYFEGHNIPHIKVKDEILFKCQQVNSLKHFQMTTPYSLIPKFIYDIGFFIQYLEAQQLSILSFSRDDIIVLNANNEYACSFMFINVSKILHIKRDLITLNSPIKLDNSFFPPDLKPLINRLPLKVHYKTAYYSFASLLIHLLLSLSDPNDANTQFNYAIPEFIKVHPSLYAFLERCLTPNPDERNFMYI